MNVPPPPLSVSSEHPIGIWKQSYPCRNYPLALVGLNGPKCRLEGPPPPSHAGPGRPSRSIAKRTRRGGRVADCVNSSPPLILQKFQGFGGIWGNSGNFGKIQGNSVEFSMALSMNSVGILGGFRGNAGFSGKFVVWGGSG